MSSKQKYFFSRRKTEIKENSFNTEVYLENINDNNKNNLTTINPEISLNDLICQTNYSEKLSKELKNSFPITQSKIKDEITDSKNEEIDLANNSKLLYLINRNKYENIDFINTLLKLKGIQTYSINNDNLSNNINSQKYEDKNNSILISKANTINENYRRNDNEEEVLKNLNNSINSINDINYNLENTSKTFNKYKHTNINMKKIDPNIFQSERMTIDFEKENFFLQHKDTISSIECNTNNSTKKNIRKNDMELINTRECCLNITNPKNYNKTLRKGLVPMIRDKNYKTLYESQLNSKKSINYNKENNINKKKAKIDVFKGKKIFNEKSSKRMNYIIKYNFDKNSISTNNSKDRVLKNYNSQTNEINLKIIDNSKKYYSKNNNSIMKNKITLNKKMSYKKNISFIKKNNKNDIINKSTNFIFQKKNRIFHKNHYKSNINEYSEKMKKTKIFEKKIKKEKIKQIMKELINNPKQIKKSNTKNIINRNLNKNNMLYDIIPFNTERKKKTKAFKIRNTQIDKLKISLNKSNNLSSYINSKSKDHKPISKNMTSSNMNSYIKTSKRKNHMTPLYKKKATKFPIRTNLFHELFYKYNNFNISYNKSNMSINTMTNKSFGLNSIINKTKKVDNIRNKNKNKANIIIKHKNQCKLLNKLKEEKKSNLKEKLNIEDKIITSKEFNSNEIQEIKILNTNEIYKNKKIYEKKNNIKRAEIFLFDNNDQIPNNKNEEKQE